MGSIKVNVKLFVALRKSVADYDVDKGVDVEMYERATIDLICTLDLPKNVATIIIVNGI